MTSDNHIRFQHLRMPRFTLILLLSLSVSALSQERSDRGMQGTPALVRFDTVHLFGNDSSKGYIGIHYRIPESFFVFVRPNDISAPRDEFLARGQLQVELFNDQDVSVAREIRPIALKRTGRPSVETEQNELEGAIPFALAPGQYHIVFEVDDLESGRSFVDKKQKVQALALSPKSLDLSPPFFASLDSTQQHEDRFLPFNHGSSVLFGHAHGGMVSQVYCPHCDSSLDVRWTLRGHTENRSEERMKLDGTQFELIAGLLTLTRKEGPVVYEPAQSNSDWRILYVPLPMEDLEPGHYTVDLNATDGKEHFKHEISFRVVWPDRPRSLTDWDITTDALRYIATPAEMDKILSGSSEDGLRAFKTFWRKRDPDTTSVYNPVMVEYYRRVDEAIRRFSTVKERDGYKTDRGRIYILNGPPTKIDRSVLPGQPSREIWTYDNIGKQFVFTEKNKSGNYILTQTVNL